MHRLSAGTKRKPFDAFNQMLRTENAQHSHNERERSNTQKRGRDSQWTMIAIENWPKAITNTHAETKHIYMNSHRRIDANTIRSFNRMETIWRNEEKRRTTSDDKHFYSEFYTFYVQIETLPSHWIAMQSKSQWVKFSCHEMKRERKSHCAIKLKQIELKYR